MVLKTSFGNQLHWWSVFSSLQYSNKTKKRKHSCLSVMSTPKQKAWQINNLHYFILQYSYCFTMSILFHLPISPTNSTTLIQHTHVPGKHVCTDTPRQTAVAALVPLAMGLVRSCDTDCCSTVRADAASHLQTCLWDQDSWQLIGFRKVSWRVRCILDGGKWITIRSVNHRATK